MGEGFTDDTDIVVKQCGGVDGYSIKISYEDLMKLHLISDQHVLSVKVTNPANGLVEFQTEIQTEIPFQWIFNWPATFTTLFAAPVLVQFTGKLSDFTPKELSPSVGITLAQYNVPGTSIDHLALISVVSYSPVPNETDSYAAILGAMIDFSGIIQVGCCYSWASYSPILVVGFRLEALPSSAVSLLKGIGVTQ
jgi:hypothetical protein